MIGSGLLFGCFQDITTTDHGQLLVKSISWESRGNDVNYPTGGHNSFGSTLHWGPAFDQNKYKLTHADYSQPKSLLKSSTPMVFTGMRKVFIPILITIATESFQSNFTQQSFWQRGQFPSNLDNPWVGQPNSAPFDQEYYLIFNLAVGGVNGYFPDGQGGKPWSDTSSSAVNDFWNNKGNWQATWQGEASALKIDSVKVWSLDSQKNEKLVKHSLEDEFMSI